MKKPFVHRPIVDSNYAKETWKILEHAIQDILSNQNFRNHTFEQLYRYCPPLLYI